jgi:hypothetical protein
VEQSPTCPRCSQPFAPLTAHDRQNLALANNFHWVCPQCLAVSDGGTLVPVERAQAQERSCFLALIQSFRTVASPAALQEICEGLRAALATGSEVRYAWANVAPEALRALWEAMERIGGAIPDRPETLMHQPAVSEPYIQALLQAVNDVVRWCGGRPADPQATKVPAQPGLGADVVHQPDFRCVRWCGNEYLFTSTQAACVRALYEAWERGRPEVGQVTILQAAGSDGSRLRDLFKGPGATHEAWGKLIVQGGTKGAFRLAKPEEFRAPR